MTDKNKKPGKQLNNKEAKLARMQLALRENLKRRKEQQRGRSTVKPEETNNE